MTHEFAPIKYREILDTDISALIKCNEIGCGTHAIVFETDNPLICVKQHKIIDQDHIYFINNEISNMKIMKKDECSDNNVVYLIGIQNNLLYYPAGLCDLEMFLNCNNKNTKIMNSIKSLIHTNNTITITDKIINDCTKAVKYLHSIGIVHFDISTDNFIYFEDGVFRITDFGVAELHSIKYINEYTDFDSEYHKLPYRSPELLACQKYIPAKTDVWALGCVFYYVIYLERAFKPTIFRDKYEEYINDMLQKTLVKPKYELIEPLNHMICVDPEARYL